ncbi:type I-E CRISPR-associated protein Cse1/CasA [Gordonia spumicola]|uniref:Type I-E CRISPR-associated protein Cse1/CasA n=1 Tax=Gordonia spumicola TaxID=589161 RepID=A0A7I9VF56_9ACTN|nr:type I-E CRISPR-associated protein Cse1/CasA [Gordonia spumicola]GEE03852.1 type I-E CRISPR-associated protein Cse1/CasA [Gordonia spumicola]
MNAPAFNLVEDPWIRVRLLDGTSTDVSLRELFHRSSEIRRIAGELPTQDFAVLRIALAVMYRSLDSDDDLAAIWDSGTLPLDRIDAYLEKWHDRFDLFHPVHPFMQVAGLESTSGETKPLGILIPDSPGPDSLFTMRRDVTDLSYAEAARWLVHCQAYDFDGIKSGAVDDPRTKGGKGYPVGVGWAGWLGGLYLDGDDLRQTLLHNWVPSNDAGLRGRDKALWELDPLTPEPRSSTADPVGPAGLFTWPIRHIRLFAADGHVQRVLVCVGDPVAKASQFKVEPMTSWRYSEPQTKKEKSANPLHMPRAHDFSRAMWRGLASLLPDPAPKHDPKGVRLAHPSRIVELLAVRVSRHEVPNRLIGVVSVGVEYGPQMSTYSEIFTDSLRLHPAAAVATGSARTCIIDAVKRADDAVTALSRLAGDLAIADGGDRAAAADEARRSAYTALDHEFRRWVVLVDGERDTDALSRAWFGMARDAIASVADQLLDSATPRSRAVRIVDGRTVSAGSAANWFRYNLLQHLPDDRKDVS